MGSPPQGYVANQLVSGAYQVIVDSAGKLGFFLNGAEVMYLDNLGSPNVRLVNARNSGSFYIDAGTSGSITLSSSFDDKVAMSNAGDLEFKKNITSMLSIFRALTTAGHGLGGIMGLDNRTGVVAADGSPITLLTTPGAAGLQLYRITADIFATAVSAGTANYTVTWTENGQAKTMVVSASVVNTLATATDLINPDVGTNITSQLTFAGFTGTVKIAAIVEWLAGN